MIYTLSLSTVAIILGLFHLAVSITALLRPQAVQGFLTRLPRSALWGNLLFIAAAGWFLALISNIELMEYDPHRQTFIIVIIIGSILVLIFAREFLSVRGLGILILLAAQVLLDAAFLRNETSRLVVTVLAYLWIVAACFWIGAPYILRDTISLLYAAPGRARWVAGSALALGVLLLGLGLFVY